MQEGDSRAGTPNANAASGLEDGGPSSRPTTGDGRPGTGSGKDRPKSREKSAGGGEAKVVGKIPEKKKKKEKKKKLDGEGDVDTNRVLLNITICSVGLQNLAPAHRFIHNQPWIKVNYGEEYAWIAEYQDALYGDRAEWHNLNWTFLLQRDTRHRFDLVVTVLSKDVIVGRYILQKEEFKNMPITTSGFFQVCRPLPKPNLGSPFCHTLPSNCFLTLFSSIGFPCFPDNLPIATLCLVAPN